MNDFSSRGPDVIHGVTPGNIYLYTYKYIYPSSPHLLINTHPAPAEQAILSAAVAWSIFGFQRCAAPYIPTTRLWRAGSRAAVVMATAPPRYPSWVSGGEPRQRRGDETTGPALHRTPEATGGTPLYHHAEKKRRGFQRRR